MKRIKEAGGAVAREPAPPIKLASVIVLWLPYTNSRAIYLPPFLQLR